MLIPTGGRSPHFSQSVRYAYIAALTLSVSKEVSIRKRSTPASYKASICGV